MSVWAFFSRSFGILALLLSVLTAFACRGPWLQTEPSWMVAVPLGLTLLLVWGGIKLVRLPVEWSGPRKPNTNKYLIEIFIGCAALGGVILTSFFHGNSAEDQIGVHLLQRTTLEFLLIPLLIVIGIGLYRLLQNRKFRDSNPAEIQIKKI